MEGDKLLFEEVWQGREEVNLSHPLLRTHVSVQSTRLFLSRNNVQVVP